MKRKKIVAGNWKMNKNYNEARRLARNIVELYNPGKTTVILAPPHINLKHVESIIFDITNLYLGAQNTHYEDNGAFTGEVSPTMLLSTGVDYVIVGHSERREYFHEDNALLAKKVNATLKHGMIPIYCCGENLEIREAGKHMEYVKTQIEEGLFHLSKKEFVQIVIAYEPIWAIGTGMTATPDQVQEMHKDIRTFIAGKYGKTVANQISILYGGSVKPGNAKEIFKNPDVDGGLIGGAALKAEDFIAIVNSF